MQYITKYHSPIGPITLASDGKHLTGLWFDGQKYDRLGLDPLAESHDDLSVFCQARVWLDAYFAGTPLPELPPLSYGATPFSKLVLNILLMIPCGATRTYGEIAAEAASRAGKEKMSARAVGSAVGHNPISLMIPCHRVIGSGGSLTGYAGGIARKKWLLDHEKSHGSCRFHH